MKFVAKTHKGKVRNRNEDLYFFDERLQIFAVTDGIGGLERGDKASQVAIQTIREWAEKAPSSTLNLGLTKRLEILIKLTKEANKQVYAEFKRQAQKSKMGTTIVVGFVTPSYLAYVSVGDSRLYVLHNDVIKQITTDDTLVRKMVAERKITRQESRVHKRRNIILRAIGLSETVVIKAALYPLIPGDTILACTDGLHDLIVNENEIADIILTAPSLEAAGDNLIKAALNYGGTDNVTVFLTTVD